MSNSVLILAISFAAGSSACVKDDAATKVKQARSEAEDVQRAASFYRIDEGACPESTEPLIAKHYLRPNYLDPWGSHYMVVCPHEPHADISVFSKGPDQIEGTMDDVHVGSLTKDAGGL